MKNQTVQLTTERGVSGSHEQTGGKQTCTFKASATLPTKGRTVMQKID